MYRLFMSNNAAFWDVFRSRQTSAEFKDLINRLLAEDPTVRPSYAELASFAWVKSSETPNMESVALEIRPPVQRAEHPAKLAIERKNRFRHITK
jgi:serine/threonine protein kinase